MTNFKITELFLNEIQRYETKTGYEYSSGSSIEFLIVSEEGGKWVKSSVESSDGEYYIVGYDNLSLNGLIVKVPTY